MAKKEPGEKPICRNKTAGLNFEIEDTYEAGIALVGTEVKALREGKGNLTDSFARVKNGEVYLYEMNISPYTFGNIMNHDPLRVRKLLLHKQEIRKPTAGPRKGAVGDPAQGLLQKRQSEDPARRRPRQEDSRSAAGPEETDGQARRWNGRSGEEAATRLVSGYLSFTNRKYNFIIANVVKRSRSTPYFALHYFSFSRIILRILKPN